MTVVEERTRRECDWRLGSGLELGKHVEGYHTGEDNLRVIRGTVELAG
jgi:hypothetical protein